MAALWAKAAPLPDTERPGYIIYAQLDEQGLPTEVVATITPDMVNTGTRAVYTPTGFPVGSEVYDRGHLLAAEFGGLGDEPGNIATMTRVANRRIMKRYENMMRAALDRGEVVHYVARAVYQGGSPIPVGITIRATGSGSLDFFVTILNGL